MMTNPKIKNNDEVCRPGLHRQSCASQACTNADSPFVFFGTPYVARDTLAIFDAHGIRPALVVTSPDAPRGRGLVLTPSETKAWAQERSVTVITPEKIHDAVIESIRAYGCDYAIVVAYGKIVPQTLLDIFPRGIFNIHYSLLPRYRGASPVEAALLNGDTETGVTIQKMVYELDAGDIVAQEKTTIGSTETAIDLRARLIEIGGKLLVDVLPDIAAGTITTTPQDHSQATRCRKIKKEDGDITADDDITRWRKYRAYAAWPRVSFEADRNSDRFRVIITKAHYKDGTFIIDTVKPAGKNEMKYEDFLRSGAQAVIAR